MALDQKWKNTIDDGASNKAWDEYDALIRKEIDEYNRCLAAAPGFTNLDWKLFKAMVWVESGGPANPAWKTRPMQIGNPGDPGYSVLKDGKEASPLIVSAKLQQDIKTGNINRPELNVRAGIAYALTRLAMSDLKSVDHPVDKTVREYTVVAGDSLARIANQVGSTVESLKQHNPGVHVLQPKQTIKYRKASIQRGITGWFAVNTANLALRYNAGDANYKEKLDYVLAIIQKRALVPS